MKLLAGFMKDTWCSYRRWGLGYTSKYSEYEVWGRFSCFKVGALYTVCLRWSRSWMYHRCTINRELPRSVLKDYAMYHQFIVLETFVDSSVASFLPTQNDLHQCQRAKFFFFEADSLTFQNSKQSPKREFILLVKDNYCRPGEYVWLFSHRKLTLAQNTKHFQRPLHDPSILSRNRLNST